MGLGRKGPREDAANIGFVGYRVVVGGGETGRGKRLKTNRRGKGDRTVEWRVKTAERGRGGHLRELDGAGEGGG